MKKIFTLLSVMMLFFALGANAQDRKTWDFTKGVSDESRALLDADFNGWAPKGTDEEGKTTYWETKKVMTVIEGNGTALKEFQNLSFTYSDANALLLFSNKIRLQKKCSIALPVLQEGQTIVIKAQSANATATDRGFLFENATIVDGPADGIVLGEAGLVTFTLSATGGVVTIHTGQNGAPAAGVEIQSIIIDEGDKNIKTWDFTAWSEATIAQVCGAEDWTAKESASKDYLNGGNQIRWIDVPAFDANNDLTAGGAAIKELKGLRHEGLAQYGMALAFDYQNLLDGNQDNGWGPFNGPKYLWVMGAASKLIIPNVKLGSTLKLGVETHKYLPAGTSDARGFKLIVGGVEVTAQTTDAYKVIEYTIPTEGVADEDGDGYADVALVATKGCHLYSIEAEVKDETVVDKNPKLGKPKFVGFPSGKVSPTSATGFTMTFPNYANIDPATEISIEGYFGPKDGEYEDYAFDGVQGPVNDGIEFTFADYVSLEENTEYEFYLTKLAVAGYEMLNEVAAEGEKLYAFTFETSGPGIEDARSWQFENDADMAAALQTSVDDGAGYWTASSKGRYIYAKAPKNEELMIDAETKYTNAEGLFFTSSGNLLVGTPAGNNGRLQMANCEVRIPSCSQGDLITVKALYATKGKGKITLVNALIGEGEAAASEITLGDKSTEYVVKVTSNDDVTLKCIETVINSISITPAKDIKDEVTVSVVAKVGEEVLETLLEPTTVKSSTDSKTGGYSYWLKGSDDLLYTYGAKGAPFEWSVSLAQDLDLVLEYKKASAYPNLKKVVFCSEAENIEGATTAEITETNKNIPIRASRQAVAFNDNDITLCTVPAGTYRIVACLWDTTKGGGGTTITFTAGDEENPISLVSDGDNMSVIESETITVTEDTPIVWKATPDSNHCLDAIVIYEYDETLGINNSVVNASKTGVVKVVENGQFLIKTAKGVFNAVGAQVK